MSTSRAAKDRRTPIFLLPFGIACSRRTRRYLHRDPGADRPDATRPAAKPHRHRDLAAMMVRPDGHVAWASDAADFGGLTLARTRWFGAPE
ncbi:aromatic-ring hydroxylase C-terminal domain-containing protein [Nocardia australiensis]|uniref:aromatic-ring hydroxylase C-terminal domain-containing protein n=1 Tax=Nocardia australiensis TaxID=2887191 RepID=UPI0035588887